MPGLIPARGHWEYELFDTTSSATFRQGSLVQLATNRQLSEYSGGEDSFVGIAMHNSVNSVPAGKVLVAIPTNQNCTAICDVIAGEASSGLSLGEAIGITKSGNTVSQLTRFTSTLSHVAVIRGVVTTSPTSTIEIAFLSAAQVYGSTKSQVIA